MAIDPLSPIAPARIRALLLPVGRIKRSSFLTFVDLLQPECMIRLGDISPDPRPDRNMFSPLAFPSGILLYELSTSLPLPSQLALSPFEQFREPLAVIGIADAKEYDWLSTAADTGGNDSGNGNGEPQMPDRHVTELAEAISDLREQFPRVYVHSLMMFDYSLPSRHPWLPEETIIVPPVAQLKTTTMKTFMCDLTAVLLAEMTTLARSLQGLPTIVSPNSRQGIASDNMSDNMAAEVAGGQLVRRNSQALSASRPDSPATIAPNRDHRMSMPVHLPSTSSIGTGALDDSRSTSPSTLGSGTPPATTFDEIPGIAPSNPLSRANSSASRTNTSAIRDSSRDRVSVHGFGSGSVSERARNKGRGRVGMVIGTLYMCAGRWQDALKELVESATRARAFSDHLWHAKGLENILVCLLLFAWTGMDFQIPQICYPIAEKTNNVKSPQHTPSSSLADVSTITVTKPTSHLVALQNLNTLLPDLIAMILNIYIRAANFAGEALPPLAFSECVIRLSKILAAMNLAGGSLNGEALQHLVLGTCLTPKQKLTITRITINPTRYEIASMIFRALPLPIEAASMTAIDRATIFAGIASVLSSLGLQRKKAIIMKEFISILIPGLVQARKVGAAEMGVHPAAGLAALNIASGGSSGAGALHLGDGEVENGIDSFLDLLCRVYGIPDSRPSSSDINGLFNEPRTNGEHNTASAGTTPDDPMEAFLERLAKSSSSRHFGNHHLKLDILRMCIKFCEALPDFQGVLHFTATLLRIAGPGTAPRPNSTQVFVSLARDEQIRLATNISRTVGAANQLGIQNIEAEYWDDFLVRGLHVIDAAHSRLLTQHRQSDLTSVSSRRNGPFIHNPFLRQPNSGVTERLIVANEQYGFVVTLQNPYDFEVEIEALKLAGDGVDFSASQRSLILGPYRTQKFSITGIAHTSGILRINGCIIKIKGCRERKFPIFAEPWRTESEAKMKNIGLQASSSLPSSRPVSGVSTSSQTTETGPLQYPTPMSLMMTVVPEQPMVVVSSISLPQSALMVLEGERKKFSITLHNVSQTTAVDFIHISFQDSATAAIQAAMTNKDLLPSELYEFEVQLAHYPTFRWCKKNDEDAISIKPGEKVSFDIEVVGRLRLTDGVVQFDYASLGRPRSEVRDRFFTRQLTVPVSITVNASIQLNRADIVPFSGDFAWSNQQRQSAGSSNPDTPVSSRLQSGSVEKGDNRFKSLLNRVGLRSNHDGHCMLLLDLRNAWPNPLSISIQVRENPVKDEREEDWRRAYTVHEIIQPGHVNRIVVMLPKLYLKDPYAPVPSLNPANQRQFVVSTSKISPEAERATREAFWYREELLKRIRGTWKEVGNGRQGDIELRVIRLSSRMVESVKLDDIMVEMCVVSDYGDTSDAVRQTGRSKFEVSVDEFLTLKTKIHNRSKKPIYPLLRLQPSLANLPHNVALDLDKRFSWSGVLQRKLPLLLPGQTVESELGFVALCSGIFDIGATVDETQLWRDEEDHRGSRPRSGTALLQGYVFSEPTLRSWHANEPCSVRAKHRGID
ncbi:hypercellular protein-like protein HypA [Lepidopterella palustris CBS 459.81]|uniref:Hypercellular protein-like protein HypA n=1 Tax=Lepidopterella palustris CBS 459.81 TaxID=1314670 RepID=A0A8E2EIU2_9PEZI|nr:hypercellular protein-like protein HypA [Lepidopterella palustris CBS 459.81]